MRIYCLLFTFLVALSSCGDKGEVSKVAVEEPADLIPQEQMILVIADIHLLEAALQIHTPHGPSRTPFSISPVEEAPVALPTDQKPLPYYDVFKKYNYTHDQYERSLKWYAMDPQLYGEMYDEVINELVRRQAQEQNGGKPVQVPVDSTK